MNWRAALLVLVLVLPAFGRLATAEASAAASIAALRARLAAHPDDPDLSWSLALALEAQSNYTEASAQMQQHLKRWPDRPPGGYSALGRCQFRAGRPQEARRSLERALALDPTDAQASLYLALTLQELEQQIAAERQFELTAALDHDLAAEALLLSGMSRISRGDTQRGYALLDQVIARAPESASARDARALLGDVPARRGPRAFGFEAWSGASYDSNVTLGGEGDIPGAGSTQGDALFDYGTEVSWQPTLGETRNIELTARYERMDYLDLTEYSSQSFGGLASGQLALGSRTVLRLDGSFGYMLLDDDPHLMSGALRPSLFYALGPRTGLLRLHAGGERLDYENDPLFDSMELSGWAYGGGAEYLLPVGQESQAWIGWGGSYLRRDTAAGRDELGFRSAYDGDRYRASVRGALRLPFAIDARVELAFDAERYDHRNLVDALTENAISPDRREDNIWSTGISFRRPLLGHIEVELHAAYMDRDSNVDLYAYERALTGLRLRAAIP